MAKRYNQQSRGQQPRPRQTGNRQPRSQQTRNRQIVAARRHWISRSRYLIAAAGVTVAALGGTLVHARGDATPSRAHSDVAAATVSGPVGPEGIPRQVGKPLAAAATSATGHTVDGVSCDASEQVVFHVHTHLAIYVNGVLRPVPAGVGVVSPAPQQTAHGPFDVATQCYYWLHVHAQDGVIHIESPVNRTYTLGDFFDIWQQPLTRTQVGPAHGPVTVFVDGLRYRANPNTIPLGAHRDIQIDVGKPVVAPKKVNWATSQL